MFAQEVVADGDRESLSFVRAQVPGWAAVGGGDARDNGGQAGEANLTLVLFRSGCLADNLTPTLSLERRGSPTDNLTPALSLERGRLTLAPAISREWWERQRFDGLYRQLDCADAQHTCGEQARGAVAQEVVDGGGNLPFDRSGRETDGVPTAVEPPTAQP